MHYLPTIRSIIINTYRLHSFIHKLGLKSKLKKKLIQDSISRACRASNWIWRRFEQGAHQQTSWWRWHEVAAGPPLHPGHIMDNGPEWPQGARDWGSWLFQRSAFWNPRMIIWSSSINLEPDIFIYSMSPPSKFSTVICAFNRYCKAPTSGSVLVRSKIDLYRRNVDLSFPLDLPQMCTDWQSHWYSFPTKPPLGYGWMSCHLDQQSSACLLFLK